MNAPHRKEAQGKTTGGFRAAFGPGIVYAAAAVGVSHLVQSTRAGADYGFALLGVILLALAIKYPFFEFGPRFSAATGQSLLEGYRRLGRPALYLFLILIALVVFPTQAAVTIVTAALLANLFPVGLSVVGWSLVVLVVVALLLGLGRYPWLDRSVKALMLLLVLATLLAVALAAGAADATDPARRGSAALGRHGNRLHHRFGGLDARPHRDLGLPFALVGGAPPADRLSTEPQGSAARFPHRLRPDHLHCADVPGARRLGAFRPRRELSPRARSASPSSLFSSIPQFWVTGPGAWWPWRPSRPCSPPR